MKRKLARYGAPSALVLGGSLLPSPGHAAWGTAESALVGTGILALGGLALATILARQLHAERRGKRSGALQVDGEQAATARALTAAGIRLFHWPEEGGGTSFGAHGLDDLRDELGQREFARV